MMQKSRLLAAGVAFALFALPSFASAAPLTTAQANAIVGLLQAFGANPSVILDVERALGVAPVPSNPASDPAPVVATPAMPALAHVPLAGSAYRSSNLGFDYSYNAPLYPPTSFGFGIIGVSGGRAFTQNPRITQEFNWAKFGAGAAPTLYMNLNAPYGSTVAGHVSSPHACAVTTVGATAPSAGSGQADPTECAGYNYGYQAAQNAYASAKSQGVISMLWWLDIETANSWSSDFAVNDAVIQGAIDYLNSQGVRAGIYSMPYMWDTIAGTSFVPAQTVNGQKESLPLWVPIGISDQLGAADYCSVGSPFVAGSPVWLVQYETSSTAVDQNFSC